MIDITLQREMRAFAAHIGHGHDRFLHDLALDVDIPLLHIRPDGLRRNRRDAQRKRHAGAADVGVTGDVVLRRAQHQGRAAFQRLRVSFVAVGVLVEYAIAAANGRFAIAERVEGETDAGRGIE